MDTIFNSYKDVMDYQYKLVSYQMKGWHILYRGHACNSFELLSMIGRKIPIKGKLMENENLCFNEYKELVKDKGWEKDICRRKYIKFCKL